MSKDHFKLGDTPYIEVKSCNGDLVARGQAESSVQIRGEYRVNESDKGIQIEATGNLYLDLPQDAILSIDRVMGNLNVKRFTGALNCEYIHGDVLLSQANGGRLGIVHGDLVARNVIGDLSLEEVNGDAILRVVGNVGFGTIHGDLSARVINGDVTVNMVNGDADLRTLSGNVEIKQGFRDINLSVIGGQVQVAGATGDIRLRGGLPKGEHFLEARGDIVVRWPADLPLNLSVTGEKIDNRLPLEDVTEKSKSLTGRIGDGGPHLSLISAGRVILREAEPTNEKWSMEGSDMELDFGVNMNEIAARIEAEVNSHLSRVSRDLESKFGVEFSQRINENIARKMGKAGERARRHFEQRDRSMGANFSSSAPESVVKPIPTEEQLRILKMVESGKITPEEAGMLLEALEN